VNESPISNPFDKDEKSGNRPIFWAILGLSAMCCGLTFVAAIIWFKPNAQSLIDQYFPSPTTTSSSTPTQTPTMTLTPTQTATPTPNWTATLQAQDAQAAAENAAGNWNVILTDTFDSNNNNWLVDPSDDEFALTTYQVADGKYRWDTTAHQSFISWVRTDTKPLTDFYLSVEVNQVEGSNSADYGVIFREDDNSNFYYLGINGLGEYALYLYYKEWDILIDFTHTDLIHPGESNRVTVIGDGPHFILFINDQYLTEITNEKIPEGVTALAVELANEGDQAVFEFDNFELRAP